MVYHGTKTSYLVVFCVAMLLLNISVVISTEINRVTMHLQNKEIVFQLYDTTRMLHKNFDNLVKCQIKSNITFPLLNEMVLEGELFNNSIHGNIIECLEEIIAHNNNKYTFSKKVDVEIIVLLKNITSYEPLTDLVIHRPWKTYKSPNTNDVNFALRFTKLSEYMGQKYIYADIIHKNYVSSSCDDEQARCNVEEINEAVLNFDGYIWVDDNHYEVFLLGSDECDLSGTIKNERTIVDDKNNIYWSSSNLGYNSIDNGTAKNGHLNEPYNYTNLRLIYKKSLLNSNTNSFDFVPLNERIGGYERKRETRRNIKVIIDHKNSALNNQITLEELKRQLQERCLFPKEIDLKYCKKNIYLLELLQITTSSSSCVYNLHPISGDKKSILTEYEVQVRLQNDKNRPDKQYNKSNHIIVDADFQYFQELYQGYSPQIVLIKCVILMVLFICIPGVIIGFMVISIFKTFRKRSKCSHFAKNL